MSLATIPSFFSFLLSEALIRQEELRSSADGFFFVNRSLSDLLSQRGILDFLNEKGARLACDKFFDDWYLYAVCEGEDTTYSLVKMREQEYDAQELTPADGDIPGVTVSFISFDCQPLAFCLQEPSDERRRALACEINRVAGYRGQRHHKALKNYFKTSRSQGAYVIAESYVKFLASLAQNGCVELPQRYLELLQESISYPHSARATRVPRFMEELNRKAGYVVCDKERIYLKDPEHLSQWEALALLAAHTGNTSFCSFGAEVEYHARFLISLAKIKLPFIGRSVYDSAVRADMTVDAALFDALAPFYREDSKVVKRHRALHREALFGQEEEQ